MRALDFYEIVEVLDSPHTRALGIAGRRGIVTGVPPHLLGIEDSPPPSDPGADQYAVTVGDDGVAIARRDLRPTGERVTREALYDGSSIHVTLEGEEGEPPESSSN